MRMQDRQF